MLLQQLEATLIGKDGTGRLPVRWLQAGNQSETEFARQKDELRGDRGHHQHVRAARFLKREK